MSANLGSLRQVASPCDLCDLPGWIALEAAQLSQSAEREVVERICRDVDAFVRWPVRAELLWLGCVRVDGREKHRYPTDLRAACRAAGLLLDPRSNGPAVMAYGLAGGVRPPRFGSRNAWSVHHLYSGKFPHPGRAGTLHAVKDGRHFTQSAGLVAVHPIADALCDEYPFVSWLLRAMAFLRFGYDPDEVFSGAAHDHLGFAAGRAPAVRFAQTGAPA